MKCHFIPFVIGIDFIFLFSEFNCTRDFSSLFIKQLSGKDVLCNAMSEWANRAIYFCINHDRSGKG